jgi:hypothetical protein
MLIKKKNGKWRMCVDYISLNKACPKDPFPPPRINQVVDSTVGCETLCFFDAYSGYHQITMDSDDQLATAFYHPLWLFLLFFYGIWVEECRRHLLKMHATRLQ